MSRANFIFLLGCGGAWLLLYQLIAEQNRALISEPYQLAGRTPILRIRPASRLAETLPVKVLFIHGLSASKSAMRHMAGELAWWGCDCYLIDLPGHGDSTERFSFQAASSATDKAVRDLLLNGASAPLVVIGHSFGARV